MTWVSYQEKKGGKGVPHHNNTVFGYCSKPRHLVQKQFGERNDDGGDAV